MNPIILHKKKRRRDSNPLSRRFVFPQSSKSRKHTMIVSHLRFSFKLPAEDREPLPVAIDTAQYPILTRHFWRGEIFEESLPSDQIKLQVEAPKTGATQ
jgi:hypothetical protein